MINRACRCLICLTLAVGATPVGGGCDSAPSLDGLEARCREGEVTVCDDLRRLFADGDRQGAALALPDDLDVPQDPARARQLAELACDGDVGASCRFLGGVNEHGQGIPADHTAAIGFYERACQLAEPESCGLAASLYHERGDRENAERLLRRGCDETGDDLGCYLLAEGFVAERDERVVLYERACQLSASDGSACWRAGTLLAEDSARREDALRLLDEGCSRMGPHGAPCHEAEQLRLSAADPSTADYRLPSFLDTDGPAMAGPLSSLRPGMSAAHACEAPMGGCGPGIELATLSPTGALVQRRRFRVRLPGLDAEVQLHAVGESLSSVGIVLRAPGLIEALETRWGAPATRTDRETTWRAEASGLLVRVDPAEWGPPTSTTVWFEAIPEERSEPENESESLDD